MKNILITILITILILILVSSLALAAGPQVTLNNPSDGETNVITSPLLNVTVTDADGNFMNVSFYESGWNTSSVVYDDVNLSMDFDSYIRDISWSSNGSSLYLLGEGRENIHQFTCNNNWDLGSCSNDTLLNISDRGPSNSGIFFKPDGMRFYLLIRGETDNVHQYSCSSAWDIESCTYDNEVISSPDPPVSPQDLFFNRMGTTLYILDTYSEKQKIYQLNCTNAWELSSCSYNGVNITGKSDSTGLYFKPDGRKLYESSYPGIVYEYSCSKAWDLSSCIYDRNFSVKRGQDIFFKPDGTRLYDVQPSLPSCWAYQYSIEDTLLNIQRDLPDGSTPLFSWEGLVDGTTYNWMVEVTDGTNYVDSEVWDFTVEAPKLRIEKLYPGGDKDVTKSKFFQVLLNVSCQNNYCGNVDVMLDPISGCEPSAGECTSACDGLFYNETNGWFFNTNQGACSDGSRNYMVFPDSACDFFFQDNATGDCAGMFPGDFCPSYVRNENVTIKPTDCSGDSNNFNLENLFFSGNPGKTGVISNEPFAIPFYTNKSANPYTITLNEGESEVVNFWVNATGVAGSSHRFFGYASLTDDSSISSTTDFWNVAIKESSIPAGVPPTMDDFINHSKTTDLSDIDDLTNVTNLTVCTGFGCVNYPNRTNITNQDLDSSIIFGDCYVAVNSTNLDYTFNATAYLLMNNSDGHCGDNTIFTSNQVVKNARDIKSFGRKCEECEFIKQSNDLSKYRVPHFSSYAIGSNSNLTVDADDPKTINKTVTFTAVYRNTTSGDFISGAMCEIDLINGTVEAMGEGTEKYTFMTSFVDNGTYDYNVTCSATGYITLSTNDTFNILTESQAVPEFNGLIVLVLVGLVLLALYKRKK